MFKITNALVFGENKTFQKKDIFIDNDRFSDSASQEDCPTLDAEGLYAIPGLIDLHFHGCMGYDFCDGTPEAIEQIAAYEASQGVTCICPATMTLPEEELKEIMENAASCYAGGNLPGHAELVGINMEGPFISSEKKGAQAGTHIRSCDDTFFQTLQDASQGLIKLVDLAPEREGSMEFIENYHEKVGISLAHTAANYDIAKEAFDRGARHVTHLYNAMPAFSHRAPGVVGAACDSPHVMAELICDGIHVHPSVVRTTFKMFGDDRIILISDSMRATGMPDGSYTLGGQNVTVQGKHATLTSNGALAGSVTNLMDCLRTVVKEMGVPLETAITCATSNPAKALRIEQERGSIAPGKIADLILLDRELNIKKILLRGEELHS